MELREYIRILVKSWWLIIPLTLIALTLTVFFSYSQTPTYESISTYVTRLDPALGTIDETIYGLDTLTGRQRIFVTYCEVMTSHTVVNRGMELLNIPLDAVDLTKYDFVCNVLPESNVLMLIVHGPAPVLVEKLNEAIGLAGISRVNQLYTYFPIENLDTVTLEEDPISPNHMSNAILGGVMGLVISVSLALLLEHFRSPGQQLQALSIRDAQLNVYKDSYFQRRLTEEINRAQKRNRPVVIVFLKLVLDEDFQILPENARLNLLRSASLHIQDNLRDGDIVAYRGNKIFEILVPEMSGHEAREMLEHLHEEIRMRTHNIDHHIANFHPVSVVVEASGESLDPRIMLDRGLEALEQSSKPGKETIQLVSTSPKPFVGDVDAGQDIDFGYGDMLSGAGSQSEKLDLNGSSLDDPLGRGPEEPRSRLDTGKLSPRYRSQPTQGDSVSPFEETDQSYSYKSFSHEDFDDESGGTDQSDESDDD